MSWMLALGCALAIGGIGLLGGYGGPSPSGTTILSRYEATAEGLSFTYPASWQAVAFPEMSSFSSLIVYLSNRPMHGPCNDGSCGLPVIRLDLGGILAWWSAWGRPDRGFDAAVGSPITVAGRRAKMSMQLSGTCGSVGADAQMTVVIDFPGDATHWYQFDACIRGPGDQTLEAQVRALLDSTTLSAPPG